MDLLLAFISVLLFTGCRHAPDMPGRSFQLETTILLPGVSGRLDHLAFDAVSDRVFVAALGNNSVEIADLQKGKVTGSIKNLDEPQGLCYLAGGNRLIVSNGGNGTCYIYDLSTMQKIQSLPLGDDADNVRYDSASSQMYVGYGNGGLAILNTNDNKLLNRVKLDGHPESFQVDPLSKRVYVNVPGAHSVEVIDLAKGTVIQHWSLSASSNFPMALDPVNNRLFIGCRHPATMLVLDTKSGKAVASVPISDDVDDIYYSAAAKEIYLSCGGGYLDIVSQDSPDSYKASAKTETSPGARTCLFIPARGEIIVAAPAHGGNEARLLIYKTN